MLFNSADNSRGNSQKDSEDSAHKNKLNSNRKPFREEKPHRLTVSETVSHVSLYRVTDPDKVLLRKALVQMVLGYKGRPRFVADPPSACDRADWVGGSKADKKENQCRHHKENRRKQEKPFKNIPNYKIHF